MIGVVSNHFIRYLSRIFVISLVLSFSLGYKVTRAETLIYLNFDDSLEDSSGRSSAVSQYPTGSTPTYVTGAAGKALSFDGTTALQLPDRLILDNADYTISFKFKTTSPSAGLLGYQSNPLSSIATASSYIPSLAINSAGKLYAEVFTVDGARSATSANAVTDGQWHTVVMTADSSARTLKTYLDGVALSTISGVPKSTSPMPYNQLGVVRSRTTISGATTPIYFNGLIDEFSFANVALSGSEVAKQTQSISFNAITSPTTSATVALTATTSSGLQVAFTSNTTGVCSVSGTTATYVSAGLCTVTASQSGDATYSAAISVSRSFTMNAPAADATAPTFDVAPAVSSVTASGFTPTASIDEGGTIYYVVVADGATAPSVAQVMAGQDSTGSAALALASSAVATSPYTSSFSAITSLSANTGYDVYFAAKDDESTANVQASVTKVDVTTSTDTTAPTLSSAAISSSGTSLVITASEALDTSSVPATSSFTVTTDGSATTVTGVGVSSNQVTLTLGQTIGTGQSVSVAYTAPASNPLKDSAGNLLASFGATSTTNSSTQSARLPSPLTKEAVVQGVKAQEKISSRASNFAMASISNRLDWLRINPDITQRSYQGIKLRFANPVLNSILNANYTQTTLGMDELFDFGKQLAGGASETSLIKSKVNAEFLNQLAGIKSHAGLNLNVNPTGDAVAGSWSGWTYGEIIVGDNATDLITKIKAKNLAFGADRPTDEEGLIGFAVTLGNDEETVASNGSALDANLFSLAGYRSDQMDRGFTLHSTLGYTRMNFDTKRLDGSQTLSGKRLGDQLFAELALNPAQTSDAALKITPFGKGSIVYSSLRAYSEQGGSYALFYAKQEQSMATVSIGVDASYEAYYKGGRLLPSLGLEYGSSKKFGKGGSVRYLSETTVYSLDPDQAKTESVQLRLGIDYQKKNGQSLNVTVRRTLRNDQTRLTALRVMYTVPLN
jgi:uncharacterized repeat protein (TIGR02059 family)